MLRPIHPEGCTSITSGAELLRRWFSEFLLVRQEPRERFCHLPHITWLLLCIVNISEMGILDLGVGLGGLSVLTY